MNILWINKITDKDFHKTTQIELSKAMNRRGHSLTLVMAKSIGEKKPINNEIIYFPTCIGSSLSGLIYSLFIIFYAPYIVKKKKIDIIMIDGTSVLLPFTSILKIFNVPMIVDIRDLPEYTKKSVFSEVSLSFIKYIMDAVTIITPELEKIFIEKYGISNKKIGIWPSGVSKEIFIGSSIYDNKKVKKDSDKFVLIHHGAYRTPRGLDNLILSLGELDDSLKKIIKLKIVGVPKEEQPDFLSLAEKINMKEQVEIIPKVNYESIPSYIQSSDVGVIPLPPDRKCWEVSVPLKTLEYLAMGKPIIATTIPFHKRIFEKGKCGVLIDNNSPKAISQAITYLFNNKEKLKHMGKTGQEIVKNHYTWDSIAFDLEKFVKTILADYRDER